MSIKTAMLKQQMNEIESAARTMRSRFINLLLDIQVALDDDDIDEARTMIKEALDQDIA